MSGLATAATAVAAVAVIVAAIAVTAILATASAAMVVMRLEFLGGGIAHYLYKTAVAHRLSCQLVVEVHDNLVVGDLDYDTLDAHSLLSHHGDEGARTDVLAVKLAVNIEDGLVQLTDHFRIFHAEGFLGPKGKVKVLSLLQTHDILLESLDEREVETKNKSIGRLFLVFEHTGLLFAVDNKDLIHEFHVFTCFDFLHLI